MSSHTVPDPPLAPWMIEARRVARRHLDLGIAATLSPLAVAGPLESTSITVRAYYVALRTRGLVEHVPDLFGTKGEGRLEGWQDNARRMAEAIVEATS